MSFWRAWLEVPHPLPNTQHVTITAMTTTMMIMGAGPLRLAAGRPIGRARRRLAALLREPVVEYLGCLEE